MEQSQFPSPHREQPNLPPTVPLFVGLDYSQHQVQVGVRAAAGKVLCHAACADNADRIEPRVRRCGTVHGAALEACTGAAHRAEERADRCAWPMHLGHPGFVSRRKQSPDQSDCSDARARADRERAGYLPRVWSAPQHLRELRTPVRERQQLVAQRRHRNLAITALWREHRQRWAYRRWTIAWRVGVEHHARLPEQARWVMPQRLRRPEWVVQEVRSVERRLEQVTQAGAPVRWLRTLKGLGPVTAWTARAAIGRFDRFRSGQPRARFWGLSPCHRSPGEKEADAGLIRAADPERRRAFVEAAGLPIRCQPRWRALAERLKAQGKPRTVVTAAVANRLVRWLYHEGVRQQAAVYDRGDPRPAPPGKLLSGRGCARPAAGVPPARSEGATRDTQRASLLGRA